MRFNAQIDPTPGLDAESCSLARPELEGGDSPLIGALGGFGRVRTGARGEPLSYRQHRGDPAVQVEVKPDDVDRRLHPIHVKGATVREKERRYVLLVDSHQAEKPKLQ